MAKRSRPDEVVKFADMFSAMATEARLRILRLLLSAHPDGMVVGEVAGELDIPASTLSHHLDKLKNENLVQVARGNISPVLREHRLASRASRVPVCRGAARATRLSRPTRFCAADRRRQCLT